MEPITARVCEERAGSAVARAIRADASGPSSPGSEAGGKGGEGGVEKERGRACAVARGGAGTWQRARRLRASREPGGRRARAPWGRNPGPGKRGGATQRDVGGGSGRVPGRSPDRNPGERIRGSDSWVPRGQPSGAARLGHRG